MANEAKIVIATPHDRFDPVERRLRAEAGLDITRLRAPEDLDADALAALDPRYIFFPHWSWKIPADVHRRFECVIFHMTDLPYGRGGSPLQNLIVRGHQSTMLTALRCVEEMDAGPVYLKRPLSLLGTAEEILMRAGDTTGDMIGEIVTTRPEPQPQSGEAETFKRRKPSEGALDGVGSIEQAYDLIRMLDGDNYPAAFADVGPFRLQFARASLRPGAILADVRITLRENEQ